jgi:hypothetical protein
MKLEPGMRLRFGRGREPVFTVVSLDERGEVRLRGPRGAESSQPYAEVARQGRPVLCACRDCRGG